jgi:hypothetical protein
MFNIQLLLAGGLKNYVTNLVHPYSTRAFQSNQECDKRHSGLGDLKMTNKQNKLPFYHG